MVSTTTNISLPRRELPRPPPPAVEKSEQQWVFTEEELLRAPSILDGMPAEEERMLRRKGVNFILQVGMMLKLPQTTLSTAAVFFNRYLCRNSLKPRPGYKPLHHYVSAPTGLHVDTADKTLANRSDCAIPRDQGRRELSQDEGTRRRMRSRRPQRP
jgi:protein BUR2